MYSILSLAVPVAAFLLGLPLHQRISECRQGRIVRVRLLRWWIVCTSLLLVSLFATVMLEVGACTSRISARQVRYSTTCKVVSKDVDLRWTKICRIGDLSPISLSMFGVPDPSKFRCSWDYYWVSAFRVEFRPYYSSVPVQAVIDLPPAALPSHCRPGFSASWKAVEDIDVNGTYPCFYNLQKLQSLDIADSNCVAEMPSSMKLFRDYIVIVLSSYKLKQPVFAGNLLWRGVYAILGGLCFAIVVTAITKVVSLFHFKVFDPGNCTSVNVLYFEARFQILCFIFLVALCMVLLTSDLEELNSGLQLVTGFNIPAQILKNWLQNVLI